MEIIEGATLTPDNAEYLGTIDKKVRAYFEKKEQIRQLESEAEALKGDALLGMQFLKIVRGKVDDLTVQWFRSTRKGTLDRDALVERGVDPKLLDECTSAEKSSVVFTVRREKNAPAGE